MSEDGGDGKCRRRCLRAVWWQFDACFFDRSLLLVAVGPEAVWRISGELAGMDSNKEFSLGSIGMHCQLQDVIRGQPARVPAGGLDGTGEQVNFFFVGGDAGVVFMTEKRNGSEAA